VVQVPVGRAVRAEPGRERIATSVGGGGIERASLSTGSKSARGKHVAKPAARATKAAPAKAERAKAAPAKTAAHKAKKK
ncbi:lytic transglycosylase, partial [Burkholderia multivorans]